MVRLIRSEGAERAVREAVRTFNEGIEAIQQFAESIHEVDYWSRFSAMAAEFPNALLNDLLPRAQKWSSPLG